MALIPSDLIPAAPVTASARLDALLKALSNGNVHTETTPPLVQGVTVFHTSKVQATLDAAAATLAQDSSSSDTEHDSNDDDDVTNKMMTPVEYLEQLFARHGYHHDDKSKQHLFQRQTTQERIDAYTMEITRVVRNDDCQALQDMYHKEGHSLDACNRFGESLLHMACRRGNADMVRFMTMDADVRPDVCDDMGRSAFHDCCWTSNPQRETMDVLLQVLPAQGLLVQDQRGHTPFDYAPRKDWNTWLEYLQQREDKLVQWLELTNIMEGKPAVTSG